MLFEAGLVFGASNLGEGVNELATQISENMLTTEKTKIAIVPFTNLDGTLTAFGQYLAEALTTKMFKVSPGKFTVVERTQLGKVFAELGLQMTGIMDETTIRKLGKILGVDAIVTGSITDFGTTVEINGRMISTETGRVFAVAATEIPKVGTVADLMAKRMARVQPPVGKEEPLKEVEKEQKFFQLGDLRIIVKSFKKSSDRIILDLIYENTGTKNIEVGLYTPGWRGKTYLVDEHGEKWELDRCDGAFRGKAEIIAKTKLATSLIFIPKGDANGKVFTALLPHYSPSEFKAIIHELTPE